LGVVIGYHNEYGLVKFQSSYWKRGLIGEISRIILCFFFNDRASQFWTQKYL
jgi:hypothetical protein